MKTLERDGQILIKHRFKWYYAKNASELAAGNWSRVKKPNRVKLQLFKRARGNLNKYSWQYAGAVLLIGLIVVAYILAHRNY